MRIWTKYFAASKARLELERRARLIGRRENRRLGMGGTEEGAYEHVIVHIHSRDEIDYISLTATASIQENTDFVAILSADWAAADLAELAEQKGNIVEFPNSQIKVNQMLSCPSLLLTNV